jgi:RHS repeat-associated protein
VDYPTCPFIFTGQRFDPETGLYFYRARYYHAALGRFLGRDPIGYKGEDFNLYRYVHNDPTNALDPSGTTDYCGVMDASCREGDVIIHVYGNSPKAEAVLELGGIDSGCVTFPDGIYCTGSCDEIKKWKSGDNPSRTILDHEACHYCILKYKGLCAYLRSAGKAPDACVGHEVPTKPDW